MHKPQSELNLPKYRPDIDGLRGIAVLAVIIFHLNASALTGGYVGVDVFFVITGFLFGSFVLGELEKGNFNLLKYYDRRARRLFPAFFCVMGGTSILACMLLMPSDLIDFWRSLSAAFLFYSNNYFNTTAGYFDTAATTKPLLHIWSLSVEAQFYFLFPLIAMVLWRWKGSFTLLWLIASLSLFVSAIWVARDPTASYFLLPSRAWEILTGVFVWMISKGRSNISRSNAEILWAGG